MSATTAPIWIDVEEILDDLEAGKSRPLHRPALVPPVPAVPLPRRPRLGGPLFLATWLTARILGRIHPRLARRALWRLWFTPWTGTVADVELPDDTVGLDRLVAGRQVRGFVLGTGPTVFAVHGWGGSSRDMLTIARDLAIAGHRVVVPDLPGHGSSPGRIVNLFEMAEALAELLTVEGPVETIVSHSLGFPSTALALEQLAERGLDHPRHVVAVAPARGITSALERFVERGRLRPSLHHQMELMFEDAFGSDIWQRLDAVNTLDGLALRGLVVHDTRDREIPHAEAVALAEAWGVELVTTEGLGHRRILADDAVRELVLAHVAG